jgi:integrase
MKMNIDKNIVGAIGGSDGSPKRPRRRASGEPVSDEQIKAVLNVADPEWKCIIQIGRETGRRLRVIARMTLGNFDLDNKSLRFDIGEPNKTQEVSISPTLLAFILSLPKPIDANAPLFPKCHAASFENTYKLNHQFEALQMKAGLRPWVFNCLRMTCFRELQAKGFPIMTLRRFLGLVSMPGK